MDLSVMMGQTSPDWFYDAPDNIRARYIAYWRLKNDCAQTNQSTQTQCGRVTEQTVTRSFWGKK